LLDAIARTLSSINVPQGLLSRINEQILFMKRLLFLLLSLTTIACIASASPTPSPDAKVTSSLSEKKAGTQVSPKDLLQSANGWNYVKGEWVHPWGFKIANGRIQRTTARAGIQPPAPPGKLALQNPQMLTPSSVPALENANKAATDKAANDKNADRARNSAPRPNPQTGSHLF